MKYIIDELVNNAGWSSSDLSKISIESENEIKEFIANDNEKSLLFHFHVNSLNAYVEKSFSSIDVSDDDELIINVYPLRQKYKGVFFNARSGSSQRKSIVLSVTCSKCSFV